MGKYLLLQVKRTIRVLPFVLLAALVLFGALAGIYSGVLFEQDSSEEQNPLSVALVGAGENAILQMGLTALDSMDSSRFALQISQMEEADARLALQRGEISAYVIFPDDFMDKAMQGTILPLRFVSPAGASNIASILRIELTRVITDILDAAQKGTYGSVNALQELTDEENPWPFAQGLALAYTQLILLRGNVYEAESLGISDGLGLEGYLFCGLCVVFLFLCIMPFAPVLIRRDLSLNRLLAGKGLNGFAQVFCEHFAQLLGYFLIMGSLLAVLFHMFSASFTLEASVSIITYLPLIFAVAAISFFLYEVASDLISGVLMQFFVSIFFCFISGCFYPGYFFPDILQKIGNVLPAGLARMYLASTLTGQNLFPTGFALIGWGAGFVLLTSIIRFRRLKSGEVGV